jgi:hypothetical protein
LYQTVLPGLVGIDVSRIVITIIHQVIAAGEEDAG